MFPTYTCVLARYQKRIEVNDSPVLPDNRRAVVDGVSSRSSSEIHGGPEGIGQLTSRSNGTIVADHVTKAPPGFAHKSCPETVLNQ